MPASWVAVLAAELVRHGHTVTGLHTADSGTDWAAHLFRAVGPRRAPAVHRALTRVLHPDNAVTGSHELQRQLNDAKAQIERTNA